MKRKMTFSLTLTLSLLLWLVSLPSTAQPAPQRFSADTGVVTHDQDTTWLSRYSIRTSK